MDEAKQVRDDGRDLAVLDRLDRLYVAVVSDCLDRMGIRDNVMQPHIRPLLPSRTHGRLRLDRFRGGRRRGAHRPRSVVRRRDRGGRTSQQAGDVMVVSTCPGSYWGELMATASRALGARGIVADCYTRDIRALQEMGYPTFVAGVCAQDSLGRISVTDYRRHDPVRRR